MSVTTEKLRGAAAVALMLMSGGPWAAAQQATGQAATGGGQTGKAAEPIITEPSGAQKELPNVPLPVFTKPFDMRPTARDYTRPNPPLPNPFAPYKPIDVSTPPLNNSPRLDQMVRDGKIYLSLSDAIALALENNFDIAIQRYNLDIADTDILRAKSGSSIRGVNVGVVAGTLGGAQSLITSGGGPGGTSVASGGAATGSAGIVSSTNGGGPAPEYLDPVLTGGLTFDYATTPQTSALSGSSSLNNNTQTYNFGYTQGFTGGEQLAVTFDNSRATTNSTFSTYSPSLTSSMRIQGTQHLLQGFGTFINRRFIVQAKRDRQITDSAFRQQVLYTVNQVENIYWGLVSAYEDEQAKERALEQSRQLAADNRKQLQIGTLAPLDVVNADSTVATDQQNLTTSQTTLEYQQLIMKQAVARNLSDPVLTAAPIIPTDRISLDPTPEEQMPVEDLVRMADQNRPEVEQADLALKNQELTVRAYKNGLLPTLDVYGYYGGNAVGGAQSPNCTTFVGGSIVPCPPNTYPSVGYGSVFSNLFNNSGPDKGVGVNMNIIIRNRAAQADQARAQLEYRQQQMKLAQTLTQVRIQVINAQFALTQDRASVQAARAANDYATKSLDAERKKYRLGASTTANVLSQQRNLASAQDNLITAETTYARDRASLSQILANTLDKYNINLADTARGVVTQTPVIPGLQPPVTQPSPTEMQERQIPMNPASQPASQQQNLTPEVTNPQNDLNKMPATAPQPSPVMAAPPPPADDHPPGNGPQ